VAAEATRRIGIVAVTERARELLLEMKASASITEPEVGFRLKLAGNDRWSLVPDEATESDQVVEQDGSTVLLVDADLADALDDVEVDCMETAAGQVELVFTRGEEA
jgi:Fe-S cluster assembly iron-binding protein IscA